MPRSSHGNARPPTIAVAWGRLPRYSKKSGGEEEGKVKQALYEREMAPKRDKITPTAFEQWYGQWRSTFLDLTRPTELRAIFFPMRVDQMIRHPAIERNPRISQQTAWILVQ